MDLGLCQRVSVAFLYFPQVELILNQQRYKQIDFFLLEMDELTFETLLRLFEFGRYPEIDKVAKQMKGCWQGCIRR
jgi:hypothetical protein